MGKAKRQMYRWDHQPGAPRVRNPDFLPRPRVQVLVLGRNRQRLLTIKQSLELRGRHEVSAYTFNEDEAVELAQWKPFDVLLVTPEVTAAEAQEGINLVCAASVNQQIIPVYVPGNDRNAVNAVLEVRPPSRTDQNLPVAATNEPLIIADEAEVAEQEYQEAKSAAEASENIRRAQAEAEEEAKAHEQARAEAKDEAAKAKAEATRAKADAARSQQEQKQQQRTAKFEATKSSAKALKVKKEEMERKARFIETLGNIFEQTDKNKDGHLTRAEVIRALKNVEGLPNLLHMPEKVSCSIQRQNTQNQFEESYQRMDIDHDSEVSFDEFKLFCLEVRSENAKQKEMVPEYA